MEPQAPSLQPSQESLVSSTEISGSLTPNAPSDSQFLSPEPASQSKFTSPPPPLTSSMTPPPSSQVPNARPDTRTPTPPTPQLTSPPPSTKLFNQASMLADSASVVYSPDLINNASAEDRRGMVADLCTAFRDMRLSAAHYKLQYNMVAMQFQELQNRMIVELEMAQREIDVLKQADERRRMSPQIPSFQEAPVNSAQAIEISELNRTCQMQHKKIQELEEELEKQSRLTEYREGELATAMEENDRLKTRIRRNRDHISQFLGYQDQSHEHGSPRSLLGTPHQPTPRQRHRAATQSDIRGQSNFEALLLADKMLHQETTTAPTTPNRAHVPRSRYGHARGAQSMSSLPHTPNRGRANTHTQLHPRTPPTFAAVNVPQSAPPVHYQHHQLQHPHPHSHVHQRPAQHLRRESSNSTITASSDDDEEAFTEREDERSEPEVQESQASQMATTMLRRSTVSGPSPHSSQYSSQSVYGMGSGSQKHMPAPSVSNPHYQSAKSNELVQSKIFGRVKKANPTSSRDGRDGGFEKRRLPSEVHEHGSPTKRGRLDEGVVGLGIGGFLRE